MPNDPFAQWASALKGAGVPSHRGGGQVKKAVSVASAPSVPTDEALQSDQVFDQAAELFRVMSAPMRLKIISSLCNAEKNVSQLLEEITTTQPNMSQHLNTLYQAGVLGKRRDGVQIFYRITNERAVSMCRAVCLQIASESEHYSI